MPHFGSRVREWLLSSCRGVPKSASLSGTAAAIRTREPAVDHRAANDPCQGLTGQALHRLALDLNLEYLLGSLVHSRPPLFVNSKNRTHHEYGVTSVWVTRCFARIVPRARNSLRRYSIRGA